MTWRVVVTGSECTGKTSLALALAERLDAPCIPEASRAYAESCGHALTADDVEPIALATMAALERGRGMRTIVCDTDLVSTMVYARAYYGECPEWIEAECKERLGDLYLLCLPDLPWVADGVRDRPAPSARAAMHQEFADALQALEARVVLVAGAGDDRTVHALQAAVAAAPPGALDR